MSTVLTDQPTLIRQGLADALSGITSVGQVSAYNLASPTPPCLFVLGFEEINYGNLAFHRGDTEWNTVVRGYVSPSLDQASQKLLDRWTADSGENSVKAALEADPTLGGAVQWTLVIRSTGTNRFQLDNQVSVWGTDFIVQVQTTAT
jgi:hypothetical protein